jgi:cytidylate kinase
MAIITISRGTFSGGETLARRLKEQLGYPCLSREEIVREVLKKYGINKKELTAAMDEPPPFWEQVPGKRIAYLKCVTGALLDHIEEGNLIYHGHVGHLLLNTVSHVLRVRVVADMEFRIKAAMERKNLKREKAIAFIHKIDKKRDKWVRFLYAVEWTDVSLYDVVFHLERIGIDGACDTITHMAILDDFKPTPKSQKALNDLILSSRVWAILATNEKTKAGNVTVTADAGKVTITGGATSQKVISAITDVTKKIIDVQEVKNEVGIGSDWYW